MIKMYQRLELHSNEQKICCYSEPGAEHVSLQNPNYNLSRKD